MSPRQQILKIMSSYWANKSKDSNAGKDPLERIDIANRLDTNIGDILPPQYFADCCYPNSQSVIATPPGPPILNVVSGSAILTWLLSPSNESYFSVQKSTDDITFNQLTTTTNFNYTDTIVTRPNTYWYRVVGVNSAGTGSYSNVASITFSNPPLAAPILSVSSGSAILSWSYALSDETGFVLNKSTDGVNYNLLFTLASPSSRSYIDSTVSAPNTYWYQMYAYNVVGGGPSSNTASISFTAPVSTCKFSPFPAQLFTASLQTYLNYDLA